MTLDFWLCAPYFFSSLMTSQWYICFQYQCHESLPTDDALLKRKWIVARISLYSTTRNGLCDTIRKSEKHELICVVSRTISCCISEFQLYTLFPFITVCVVARGLRFDYEWALYMLYLCTLNLNMYMYEYYVFFQAGRCSNSRP